MSSLVLLKGFLIIVSLYFQDYSEMSLAYRPSHADATYDMKYGVRSVQVLTVAMWYHDSSGIIYQFTDEWGVFISWDLH